ncbi:MAG: hypothetical protein AB7P03_00380 [Kofleriaceae bacterium]
MPRSVRGRILAHAAVLAVTLASAPAFADRELCARGTKFRGRAIDLDVKSADIHDVFRVLADAGRANLVVSDEVAGKVTLRIKRAPWDQIACAVAALHHLEISVQGSVLIVRPTPRR